MPTTSAAACTTTCLQETSSTARDAPRGRVSGRGSRHDADHSDGRAHPRETVGEYNDGCRVSDKS